MMLGMILLGLALLVIMTLGILMGLLVVLMLGMLLLTMLIGMLSGRMMPAVPIFPLGIPFQLFCLP